MDTDALLDNETAIYNGRLHWAVLVVPGIVSILAIAGSVGLVMIKQPIPAAIIFAVLLAWLFPAFIRYRTNGLVLTTKRVISRTGVISRRSIDLALTKIEGVSFEQNLFGQILNYGTIVIRGTGGGIEQFPTLAAPAEFSRQVHQQIGRN